MPVLIGCVANAYHHLWGSTDTNPRGPHLVEYLVTTELDIRNIGNTPTFRNAVREEVLDITLCTSDLTDRIANWRVSDDHRYQTTNRSGSIWWRVRPRDPNGKEIPEIWTG